MICRRVVLRYHIRDKRHFSSVSYLGDHTTLPRRSPAVVAYLCGFDGKCHPFIGRDQSSVLQISYMISQDLFSYEALRELRYVTPSF
jgi:hypothetical protein